MTARKNKMKEALDNEQEMTAEQAQGFLNKQAQVELQKFATELDQFLATKKFRLIAVPFVDDDGRIRAQVRGIPVV